MGDPAPNCVIGGLSHPSLVAPNRAAHQAGGVYLPASSMIHWRKAATFDRTAALSGQTT